MAAPTIVMASFRRVYFTAYLALLLEQGCFCFDNLGDFFGVGHVRFYFFAANQIHKVGANTAARAIGV